MTLCCRTVGRLDPDPSEAARHRAESCQDSVRIQPPGLES